MRIQHNIMAMNAYRNYNTNTSALSKNLEKLSSGYKINRAGDDAAGLAISEKMRGQISGLKAASKNVKDGISLVKTAEGAMQEIQDMLNRMKYLATQSANGTYDNDTDRFNLQKEVDSLRAEIDRIADSANFNGINLLDGKMGFGATAGAGGGDPTAPSATVDTANDAAGIGEGGLTVAFDANATAAQKTALAGMAGDITVKVTDVDGNTSVDAGDKIEVDLSAVLPEGYKAYWTDEAGTETEYTGGKGDLEIGTSTGKLKANDDIVFTLKDNENKVAGTITVKMPTKAVNGGAATTKVTLAAANAAAAAADDAQTPAANPGGFKYTLQGGTAAIGDGKKISINGKDYTVQNDGKIQDAAGTAIKDLDTPANDFTETGTDADAFKKQMAAIVSDYNANAGDTKWTVSYDADTKEFMFAAKDGVDLANETAPTLTTDDTAAITSVGNAEKVEPTNNNGGGAGGNGSITLQIGDTADKFNQLTVKIGDMHVSALGKRPGTADIEDGKKTGTYSYADVAAGQSIEDIDISTLGGAQTAINVIKDAINYVSSVRGDLGAVQNRLEHTANNLSVMTENIQDAESTIRDTDVAEEMMAYTKNNILIQSAQAMLAQANAVPQGVLQLLG